MPSPRLRARSRRHRARPPIDDELRAGVRPDSYDFTLARLMATAADRAMRRGDVERARSLLGRARDTDAALSAHFPDGPPGGGLTTP